MELEINTKRDIIKKYGYYSLTKEGGKKWVNLEQIQKRLLIIKERLWDNQEEEIRTGDIIAESGEKVRERREEL